MTDETQRRDAEADGEPRQPERKREDGRARTDENEAKHSDPSAQLGELDEALETHDYPATTEELVEAYGDHVIETRPGEESLADVLAATANQTYDSADDVRSRILGLIHR